MKRVFITLFILCQAALGSYRLDCYNVRTQSAGDYIFMAGYGEANYQADPAYYIFTGAFKFFTEYEGVDYYSIQRFNLIVFDQAGTSIGHIYQPLGSSGRYSDGILSLDLSGHILSRRWSGFYEDRITFDDGSSILTVVPEPSSILLFFVGASLWLRKRSS